MSQFPIKTPTACRLKWAWSTIYLNSGQTASCHRASYSTLSEQNFDSFHNTPDKLNARKKMLDGAWPGNGCEYCRDIEQAGGYSERQFQLEIPDVYPRELDLDSTLVDVQPSILEVFFSNTCNFKCVYCQEGLSSSIQAEEIKWGGPIIKSLPVSTGNQYKNLVPQFWSWMERNGSKLQRLQILGGEPFLQSDFYKLLDYFEQYPNPLLEFNVVTNLHIPNNRLHEINKKLLRLLDIGAVKRVDIQVSVDCWGQGQEYVRYGFDRAVFEDNLQIITSHKQFRIGLNSILSSLTIMELPALVEKFQEWNTWQTIFWYMAFVAPYDSSPFSPLIFDYEVFSPALSQVKQALPRDTWDQQQTYNIFTGIDSKMKNVAKHNAPRQQELLSVLDEIDHRRSLDWRNTFPWLVQEVSDVV